MKRLAVLLSLAFLSPAVAHADGCPASSCGTTSTAVPGSNVILVRPNGQQGPLVGYDVASGIERFWLSRGLVSADGRSFFAVRWTNGETTISRYALPEGRFLRAWTLAGRAWPTAVSAHGELLALGVRSKRRTTAIPLFDTRRGRVVRVVELHGSFRPEAISSDGGRLFLTHWRRYDYDLQVFDLSSGRLHATRLAEPEMKLTGSAITAVATRDGRWLLTFYVGGGENGSFVHALDLSSGVAHCIDLPWRFSDFNEASTAALALSPDEQRLYVANPVLGRIAVVSLRRLRVTRDVRFAPLEAGGHVFGIGPNAAVTPNGRVLAFSGGRKVWLYDTAYGIVHRAIAAAPPNYGIQISATGLGFSADGRHLTVLLASDRQAVIDAARGRRVRAVPVAAAARLLSVGRPAADGSRAFAAIPRSAHTTAIETYSQSNGELQRVDLVSGRWSLGAVSATGSTLALSRRAGADTRVRVVDVSTLRTLHERSLRGDYSLDAVTDDGKRVFLIRHYRSGSYSVQALDLVRNRLRTATLREKGVEEDPVMTGVAAGQVASSDGRWLLTLYLNSKEKKAFVHALNLRAAYAVCIDLPSGSGNAPLLRAYSLSLAPDGSLYAANPALGVLARVDLRKQSVTDRLRFRASPGGGGAASAVSQNGRMLYFASGRRVWSFDTAFRIVRGPYAAGAPVVGLAFSGDGRRVFAARERGGVVAFDAARGTVLKA